jgi:hypothetical protein
VGKRKERKRLREGGLERERENFSWAAKKLKRREETTPSNFECIIAADGAILHLINQYSISCKHDECLDAIGGGNRIQNRREDSWAGARRIGRPSRASFLLYSFSS